MLQPLCSKDVDRIKEREEKLYSICSLMAQFISLYISKWKGSYSSRRATYKPGVRNISLDVKKDQIQDILIIIKF